MQPIYNDELYHFGKLGMKWGRRLATPIMSNKSGNKMAKSLTKYNKDYKTKINKIANSKTAHKADVEYAKKVNMGLHKRIGKELTGAILSTLVADVVTGKIKNYKNMGSKEVIEKMTTIGKRVATNIAKDEITARSVANKYNTKGERIKGSNKEMFTREQVAKTGIRAVGTAVTLSPFIRLALGYKVAQMNKQKKAGEEAFARWGANILTDKVSDYSNIIPNVNYSVK